MEDIHQSVDGNETLKFEQRTHFRFLYFNLMNDYSGANEFIVQLENDLKKHEGSVMPFRLLDFYFNGCVLSFKLGDFDKALVWLNRVLNINPSLLLERVYLEVYARIFDLIIHFELNNFDYLYHRVISTYRFLYKQNKLGDFEKTVLQFIRGLIRIADDEHFFQSLQKFIEALRKIPSPEYAKIAHDQFDYMQWAQKKIDNRIGIFKKINPSAVSLSAPKP